MATKLLLFDFDGTLVDSFAFAVSLANKLAKKHHFKQLKSTDIELLRHKGMREVMKIVGIPWWKVPLIMRDVKQEFKTNSASIPLIPGIKEVLEKIDKRAIKMGILTSNAAQNVKIKLEEHQISSIDFVVGDVGMFAKKKSIAKVIKHQSLNPTDIIYIGDEIRDIEAAKKAGVKVAAVTWGFTAKERLEQERPDYVLVSPSDLLSLI